LQVYIWKKIKGKVFLNGAFAWKTSAVYIPYYKTKSGYIRVRKKAERRLRNNDKCIGHNLPYNYLKSVWYHLNNTPFFVLNRGMFTDEHKKNHPQYKD